MKIVTRVPIDPKLKEQLEKHCRIEFCPEVTGETYHPIASVIQIFPTGGADDGTLIHNLEQYRKRNGTYGSVGRRVKRGDPVGILEYSLEIHKGDPPEELDHNASRFEHYHNEKIEEEKAARRNGTWVL